MSLRECRLAKGLRAKSVVEVLRASGSRVDAALYSHAEAERVDLTAKDRLIVAKLLDAPYEAVATAIPDTEKPRESYRQRQTPSCGRVYRGRRSRR